MKRLLLLFTVFLSLFILSCSNPQTTVLTQQESTLRNAVMEKNANTIWTKEIEAEKLSSKMNDFVMLQNKSVVSPQFLESIIDLQGPVYPQIKDLASLDCSSMNKNLFETINNFAKDFCKGLDSLDQYFYSDYFFNYVFFKKDFSDQYEVKEGEKLFDQYYICQAFESDDLIQIPIRFYKSKEYVDLSVYLSYHNGYKINQIEIIRWGNLNGKRENSD